MYYHIIPRYFSDTPEREVRLDTLEIPELGFKLDKNELKTIKPYPNKKYSISCLKHGFKGRNFIGLVVESEQAVLEFTKICLWTVNPLYRGEPDIAFVMEHTTKYRLFDNGYSMFSDDYLLYDMPFRKDEMYPKNYCEKSVMEFCAPCIFTGTNVQDEYNTTFDEFYESEGVISHRKQNIEMFMINEELYREKSKENNKCWPSLETAIKVNINLK